MCEECGWEDLLVEIDDLLDNPDYEFANDTLVGIYDWISDNEHCTENQQIAVKNIANSVDV